MRRNRHRSYFITINNYKIEEISCLKALCHVKYMVIGEHVGEKSKIPHIHALVEFTTAIEFTTVKLAVPRANIELKRGTGAQARKYIAKENKILYEYGSISAQGKKSIVDIKEAIKKNGKVRPFFDDLTFSQFKTLTSVVNTVEPTRDFKTVTIWICGKTGIGKSRVAKELCEYMYGSDETYFNASSSKFFSCYDAHDACIIDEFRFDSLKFTDLLRISDRYPYSIEVKGGFRQFLSKILFITSPLPPSETFLTVSSSEDMEQLHRRIIIWYMSFPLYFKGSDICI